MTEDELKNMKLHEVKIDQGTRIMRVYKGWIYTFKERTHCNGVGDQFAMSSVFVPYN